MTRLMIFSIPLVLMISCSNQRTSTDGKEASGPEIPADYLLGSWIRTNDEEGQETYETWNKEYDYYYGTGYMLEGGDTVFKELLRIVMVDSSWVYEVSGVNEAPTLFKITEFNEKSFRSENPENKFPKVIAYQFMEDSLIATIASNTISLDYIFKPMKD